MKVKKCLLISLVAVLSFVTGAAVAQQCSNTVGTWTDNYGYQWYLTQSGSNVYGSVYVGLYNPNCVPNWEVVGTHSGGQVEVTALNPTAGMDYFCADYFTYTGPISTPGCNTGAGTWSNPTSSGSWGWEKACAVPSGETTHATLDYWVDANNVQDSDGAYFRFRADIFNAGGGNLSGRQIKETDYATAVDNCWYPDSSVPKVLGVTNPFPATLGSDNVYKDRIGLGAVAIIHYRAANRAPCAVVVSQRMKIACDTRTVLGNVTSWEQFKDNILVSFIGSSLSTLISNERDSEEHEKVWQ